MTRFVVRPPSIHKTPQLIAERLDAETRRADFGNAKLDPKRDLFLAYPNPARFSRWVDPFTTAKFRDLYQFVASSKAVQRLQLRRAEINVPESTRSSAEARTFSPGKFIVRPNHHQGGIGYRLTDDPTDFIQGQEYVQRVFPKDREYRVIYAFGDPILLLLKRKPEGVNSDAAWNHQQGAYFVTVTKDKNDRLQRTDFYDKMSRVPIINHGHIVAADVMWSDDLGYSVCEVNTCPGLTIPSNLERIVNHVKGHRQSR